MAELHPKIKYATCVICDEEFEYEYFRGTTRTRCDKHRHSGALVNKPEIVITEVRPLEEMRATGLEHNERKTVKHLVGLEQLRRYIRERRLKL